VNIFYILFTGGQWRTKDFIMGGQHGPKAGVWFWGGEASPSPPAVGSGERCKLPQRGPWRSPCANRFCLYL